MLTQMCILVHEDELKDAAKEIAISEIEGMKDTISIDSVDAVTDAENGYYVWVNVSN